MDMNNDTSRIRTLVKEVSSVDDTREWVDQEIRKLVRMYLDGRMNHPGDKDELQTRIDGLLIAAGIRRRHRTSEEAWASDGLKSLSGTWAGA